MAVRTWTVDELCHAVGDALRAVFPDELWIRGEISGLTKSRAGHVYFDLIEPGANGRGADTRISVVAFRGPLRGIEAVLAKVGNLRLEDGIEVRIRGRIDYYPPQGRVQFLMNAIDPRYTLGQLAADRDEVLRSLAADGLLDTNREKQLALVPLRVGLITSDESAAFSDFVDELRLSGYRFEITLADARVQGLDAEASLTAAFRALAGRPLDVIALVRGGGARTDLVAFDKEAVARAVATSPVPVFVGIGHEIDRSVVDEVCHSSLKTPTACAGALIERVRNFDAKLTGLGTTIASRTRHRLDRAEDQLDRDRRHLARATIASVRLHEAGLQAATRRLQAGAGRHVTHNQAHIRAAAAGLTRAGQQVTRHLSELDVAGRQLAQLSRRTLDAQLRRISAADTLAAALHPDRILQRGFSITRTTQGQVANGGLAPGDQLVTETATSQIESLVTNTRPKERP